MDINKRRHSLRKKQRRWEQEKEILVEQIKLKEDKDKVKNKKVSTSKLIILFLFINCTIVELFTGYITLIDLRLAQTTGIVDFTPIVTLIGAVVGEVISFAIYAVKSTKENTQGGITYQSMMNEYNKEIGG